MKEEKYIQMYENFLINQNKKFSKINEAEQITAATYEQSVYNKSPEEFLKFLYSIKINDLLTNFDQTSRVKVLEDYLKSFTIPGTVKTFNPTVNTGSDNRIIGLQRTKSENKYALVLIPELLESVKDKNISNLPVYLLFNENFSKNELIPGPVGTLAGLLGYNRSLTFDSNLLQIPVELTNFNATKQPLQKLVSYSLSDNAPTNISQSMKNNFASNYLPKLKDKLKGGNQETPNLASNTL